MCSRSKISANLPLFKRQPIFSFADKGVCGEDKVRYATTLKQMKIAHARATSRFKVQCADAPSLVRGSDLSVDDVTVCHSLPIPLQLYRPMCLISLFLPQNYPVSFHFRVGTFGCTLLFLEYPLSSTPLILLSY